VFPLYRPIIECCVNKIYLLAIKIVSNITKVLEGSADTVAVGLAMHLTENLGVNGRIILMWFFMEGAGDLDWIVVAQGRDRWQALVNLVMNLRGP
jgi:hypothetical protein